jgi:hypothetical protein
MVLSEGRINVGDYIYQATNMPMLPIRPFGKRRYAPYVQGASA